LDATKANPSGVPNPEDSIASLKATFARTGLSTTEMIQLVACGHTMGGVKRELFPNIVKNQDEAHFDTTVGVFDNRVASEYVDGTTQNPLVVSPNVTTRSDFKIFSSDNNATIKG
jgi:catalase (peroxidase I)